MRNKLLVILSIVFFVIILVQCSDQPNNKKPRFTMAKDSELTLLMRDMYTYFDSVKTDIKNDNLSRDVKTFADIHSAVATSPEKSSSDLYQGMAEIYLRSAERINKEGVDKQKAFNIMLDNCMNCHQQLCPGPMVRIKKLYLDLD